jgi:hypothetical protein
MVKKPIKKDHIKITSEPKRKSFFNFLKMHNLKKKNLKCFESFENFKFMNAIGILTTLGFRVA